MGSCLNCREVDLRSRAGNANNPLKAVIVWPPILSSSNSQASRSFQAMNNAEFQLQGVSDPRLAVHASSPLPPWLWLIDGTRVLWAHPVGPSPVAPANSATVARK